MDRQGGALSLRGVKLIATAHIFLDGKLIIFNSIYYSILIYSETFV